MNTSDILLTVRSLSKSFGGVKALDGLDLDVRKGQIHGLIGPNGSGKSTTLHILNGFLKAEHGTITLDGTAIGGEPPHRLAAMRISRTFQTPAIFPDLTLFQNVLAGCHTLDRSSRSMRTLLFNSQALAQSYSALDGLCFEALSSVGLGARANQRATDLSYGDKKLLDLAKAIVCKPRLLLCDEPAAGMSTQGVEGLTTILTGLSRAGTTIIIAEHNMKLVLGICHHVTTLDFGQKIFDGSPQDLRSDPAVIKAYLGSAATQ